MNVKGLVPPSGNSDITKSQKSPSVSLILIFFDADFVSSHLLNIVSGGNRGSITANKCSPRQRIQVIVLRGVSGALEHVQHPLGDQETT